MIEDYSRDLLRSGIIELKAGNPESAHRYIDRALYMSTDHDVLAEGWYWMSQLTDDPVEKRQSLENCLSHDLRHARARRALAVLDGKLKPEDIVDPDATAADGSRLRRQGESGPQSDSSPDADAQRFMCAKCGGRMHFAPDGQSLVCDYCTRHLALRAKDGDRSGPHEVDFLLTMATARGHGKPLTEQVFHCQGCGAQFILPAGVLSITCPYCGSPHAISFEKSPDLLAPDGIIPHAFDQARAAALLSHWLQEKLVGTAAANLPVHAVPRGLYLPLWTFEVGGAIDYTGEVIDEQDAGFGRHAPRMVRISDRYPVMLSRLPIPASRKLSAPFIRLVPTYDLKAVQLYDPRYLADWPAELYDIPMAEASLDARSQGYAVLKRDMALRLSPVHLISASSANLTIESFRLNLVPVWMTEVVADAVSHLILVNGQTGDVYGDLGQRPSHSGKILDWLSDLINDK
jgi:DNA-directed RNA polymerase subunit RPC12/RpoP